MTLDELKPEEYTLDSDTEKKSDFYGQNIPVAGKLIGGLSNIGIGIGTEIGKGLFGISELALRAAGKVTGIDPKQEIEMTKKMSSKLYEEPFKEELGTTTGKAGQLAGIAAQFMAPSSKILASQKILSALARPLTGGSRLAGFGAKVITRALPEAISDFGVELARSGGDVKRAEFAGITGGIASGVFTTLGSAAKATFWPELRDSATRALGVQGKTTGGRILPQIEKKVAGLGVIKKYSPLIKVKDDLGIEKAFKPERANFHETLQAWNQTRKIIYNAYSDISSSVGDDVAVDISKISDNLSDIVNSPRTSVYQKAAQERLDELAQNFGNKTRGEFNGTFRKINPKDLEVYLSDLYNEAGATLAGRSDKAHGEIATGVAGKLRQFLDSAIENASGPQYSKLRGEYSALKEIEQDLVRRFQQEARQVGGGLTDYVNLFSSGDIISGIMTGQPALIAKGTTQGIMGRLFKSLKKPDRYMRRAFDLIDQKKIGDISARLFGTSDEALSPTEARIVNSVRSYLKNPKIGMSIEDVSKKGSGAIRTTNEQEIAQTLRGTKGLTADQITQKHPDIVLKRDVPATDIYGNKVKIPEGEALTPYELKGNKVLLQDGETYIVSKNQFQNIKGNAVSGEAKPFAPELKGTEETVKGTQKMAIRDKAYADFDAGKITREQRNAIIDKLGVPNETKFSQYQLPEGKNYKEILIKAPRAEKGTQFTVEKATNQPGNQWWVSDTMNESDPGRLFSSKAEALKEAEKLNKETGAVFKSSHWDEPNVISHLRLNERTYQGKKVTFMEELQSDWARTARTKAELQTVKEIPNQYGGTDFVVGDNTFKVKSTAENFVKEQEKFPTNPLLKNWQELSVKRALKEAVDNKSEYFAWITGEQTSARYNLATHLDDVKWHQDFTNNIKRINLSPKGKAPISLNIKRDGTIIKGSEFGLGGENVPSDWAGKKLDEVIGKGLADKIMEKETGQLSGEGLAFGGEWAKNLYDKQVKNIVEDITGHKTEIIDLKLPVEGKTQEIKWHNGSEVAPKDLTKDAVGGYVSIDGDNYTITNILKDGKFKAINSTNFPSISSETMNSAINKRDIANYAETFDISTKKSAGQQAIKITPEIRAMVKGEAKKLPSASGKMFDD